MRDLIELDCTVDDSQSQKDILETLLESRSRKFEKMYFQSSYYSMQYLGSQKWLIQSVREGVRAHGNFKQVKDAILVKWKSGRFIVKPSVLIEGLGQTAVQIPEIGFKSDYILTPKPVGTLNARATRALSDLSVLPPGITGKAFLKISANFLKGIGELHLRGKIHGDVKPQNALFFGDDRVKICDLDSVKDEQRESQFTFQTYWYLAPYNRKIFLKGRFLDWLEEHRSVGRFDLATQTNINKIYCSNDANLRYCLSCTNEVASAGFALAGMYFQMRRLLTGAQQTEYRRIINELTGGWGLSDLDRHMADFSARVDQDILKGKEITLPADGALTKAIGDLERLSLQV